MDSTVRMSDTLSSETPVIISIEGNIGSGKSTLVSILQKKFELNSEFCFLQEPVDVWNTIKDEDDVTILERFYNDTEKFAFQFQMMAYISRLSILKNALKNKNYKYIISERCVYTDANVFAKMLYDDKKITLIEYTIYKKWFNQFIEDIPDPIIIYVTTSPEIANERVIKRHRQGEHIPLEYLIKCNQYHIDWLGASSYKMLTLDGNEDINKNPEIITEWLDIINGFIQ